MKSLRARLLLGFGILFTAALGAFGALAYLLVAHGSSSDLDDLLKTKLFIAKQQSDFRKTGAVASLEQALDVDRGGFFLQFFGPDGTPAGKSAKLVNPFPLSEATRLAAADRGDAVLEDTVDGKGNAVRIATASRYEMFDRSRPLLGFVQVGVPLAARDARLHSLLKWMLIVGPLVLLTALGMGWLHIGRWLGALATVEDTARRISAATLSRQRVFVAPGDAELARLAHSFNELLDRLEASYATQQRFVADASHEMRTPLTVLRGEIEVALRRPRSPGEYQEVLNSSREEIERLSRLVENLLTLASADAGEGLAQRESVELAALAREVATALAPAAEAKRIALSVSADQAAEVHGDRCGLARVLTNLIENAIRYSPNEESVRVRVIAEADWTVVEISDTGPGIAPEHLPHIFERFYRVDKARSRDLGGAGLGLSIVKALVESHGGTVEVKSRLGHGTVFAVRLPKAPTAVS